MKRVDSAEPECCFDITVRAENGMEKVYRTLDILSIASAESMRGRATRVWKCCLLDKDGNPNLNETVILKDSWVDLPRPREGHLYQRISRLAVESGNTELVDSLTDVLLSMVCHGEVYIDDRPDYTKAVALGYDDYQLVYQTDHQKQKHSREFASQKGTKSHTGTIHTETPGSPNFHRKVHYRIVFSEVGKPLHQETSLYAVFSALHDVCFGKLSDHGSRPREGTDSTLSGLQTFHDLRFVHRDISSSNILIVDSVGKISDLEYIRKIDDIFTSHHNVRTVRSS